MCATYGMSRRKGNNSLAEGIQSVGVSAPSFLSVYNSPITDSGVIELHYNDTPLPISSGGTGTTTVGEKGQILSVISTEPAELGWINGSGTGTVTSVSMTVPEFLNVSPSSITSSGSFDITLSSQPIPISSGGTGLTSVGAPSQILSVNSAGTAFEFTSPSSGTVSSVALSSSTPFLSVSSDPVTSLGTLSIDCDTIPVSHGGTGLTTVGLPSQILTVNSEGTGLEFTTPSLGTVTSVAFTSTTPFLSVSPDPVTTSGTFSIDCGIIPVSHGGTGLTAIGLPSQILAVNSEGTSLEFTTPNSGTVTSVSLTSNTPFLSVSQDPVIDSGILSIDCDIIPVSHGGTGLVAPGQADQILTSDGSSLYWKDPPNLDQYLTTIQTESPLAFNNGKLFIPTFTGTGNVVYENSPTLITPTIGDATCSSINVKGSDAGIIRISSKSGSYNFILPESNGRPDDILTSQGPFVPTSWSSTLGSGSLVRAPTGSQGQILSVISETPFELGWVEASGTGTVTSVSMTVPEFLNVSPSSITSSGSFDITLSSQPIPISSGGTGLTSVGLPSQILSVNSAGTAFEFITPTSGTVSSVALSSSTPFLSVSSDPVTSLGILSIDCDTIPVSHGGTGLTTVGLPLQILSVNSEGTGLEFTTPQSVTSVALTSTTPFISVSSEPVTSLGTLSIDCGIIPVSHGGTGLTAIGLPSQILAVNSEGTSLEFTTPQQYVTSVALTSTTSFLSVSSEPVTSLGTLSIDCDTIPVSHGGTGLVAPGQADQILTSDGSSLYWKDPPNLNQYLTTIQTISPLSYANSTLSISAFTGSGNVVYDMQPVLNTPTLIDPKVNNLTVSGSQTGTVTLKAVSGDYNFILPTSLGTYGQVLTSNGIFNPVQWTSTSGVGDIVRSQNSVLTGQTILTNGTVVCKSALIQSKGISLITESTSLSMSQFISLLTIDSENSITITTPSCEEFNEFMGDFTIGNRIETLIHNKCPELIIIAPEGIVVVDGRVSPAIPVQTCTYIMKNSTEGLLLIK